MKTLIAFLSILAVCFSLTAADTMPLTIDTAGNLANGGTAASNTFSAIAAAQVQAGTNGLADTNYVNNAASRASNAANARAAATYLPMTSGNSTNEQFYGTPVFWGIPYDASFYPFPTAGAANNFYSTNSFAGIEIGTIFCFNSSGDIQFSSIYATNILHMTPAGALDFGGSLSGISASLGDLTVTNPIAGSITGNAATATRATNAATATSATYAGMATNLVNSSLVGSNFKFDSTVNSAATTNLTVNIAGAVYQKITMTNNIYLSNVTNGPGPVSLMFRPNGANRSISWPTNFHTLNTNGLIQSGGMWTLWLTNGPRIAWVSIFNSGNNYTNNVISGAVTW